ncbi:MAG TPA: hypothetical protein DD670_07355, partial [Planctomycetaceae bacterium]|nr:hypothetical protein [Planctomycetaceae bacterium]
MDDHQPEIERLQQELARARDRLAALEATEARHAETLARLRESETRYRQLVENVNSVILRMDRRGNITFVNRFACSFFGYPEDELLGKNVVGTIVPEVDGAGQNLVEEIRDICEHPERHQNHENENMHRDGGRVWVAWTNKGLFDQNGELAEILCIGNDLTGRKHYEEALQASEQNYREIFNATMNAIFIHEIPTGRVVDVNQTMLDMFGLSRDEAMRGTVEDISEGHSPYSQREADELLRKAAFEGPQKFEWRSRRSNGELFWTEVTLKQAVIGGIPRVLALAIDITQRKHFQERLIEEQQLLHQLLEAQERERRLIAFEIHDGLAQQLTAASMYCGNFERLCRDDLDQAIQSHEAGSIMLQKALAETRRLIRGLRPPVLDESGLVAAIEHLLIDMKESGPTEIEFLHEVQFDRLDPAWENSLFRIVQESLTNALRYSESPKIQVRLRQEPGWLLLEVEDWGNGFDTNQVERSCFGLKGIRERAGLLGGTATIETTPGKGTRVRVELPLNKNTPAA